MLKYNEKIGVTKEQFVALKKEADGICAFRTEGDKFFIKLLMPKYSKYVDKIINSN